MACAKILGAASDIKATLETLKAKRRESCAPRLALEFLVINSNMVFAPQPKLLTMPTIN